MSHSHTYIHTYIHTVVVYGATARVQRVGCAVRRQLQGHRGGGGEDRRRHRSKTYRHMCIPSPECFSYLCMYIPMMQKSIHNTLLGAVIGSLPPFIGTMA